MRKEPSDPKEKKVSRRFSPDLDRDVFKILINLGRPVRWMELEEAAKKKKIAPKVLSKSLKRLREKGLVSALVLNGGVQRPSILYKPVEQEPFGELSKSWNRIYLDALGKTRAKGATKEFRKKVLKDLWAKANFTTINLILSVSGAALKQKNDEAARQEFSFLCSAFEAEAFGTFFSLLLDNRDVAQEVVDDLHLALTNHLKRLLARSKAQMKTEAKPK